MTNVVIHQQKHGYRNGHQLLEGTVRLGRVDQDTIDRLSDLSGQIRPGEILPPYITIYPLPSRAYHVVARTWPDKTAPRAGCVLTRSLLVPAETWHESAHLQWLLAHLTPPGNSKLVPIDGQTVDRPFPPSVEPRTAELVEALFLEARKPIVVFDANEADLLATRLVTALWPAFRSDFSVCTYALGPRKISGRDFDLVFAPKSARSRFSNWSGRKIEAGSPRGVRHRWSTGVVNSVFHSPYPTLASGDALGLLGSSGPGDEAAFRKSLMWNELAEKAPTSSSALLGMLDIVNSQPGLVSQAMRSSGQMLISGIGSAIRSMSSGDAWIFLQTLSRKVQAKEEFALLRTEARKDAERLAIKDPTAAIEFVHRFEDEKDSLSRELIKGLADGLGAVGDLAVDYRRIPPHIGLCLIATSSSFTTAVANGIRTGTVSASDIAPYFQAGDGASREKAASKIVPQIDSREFLPLLPHVLKSSSAEKRADHILGIILCSGLQFPEFDDALADAIRDEATMQQVRSVALSDFQESNLNRFLAKIIRLVPDDIGWLSDGPIKGSRSAALLAKVIEGRSDSLLVAVEQNSAVRRKILDTLARDVESTAPEMARTLLVGAACIEDLLEFAQLTLGKLPKCHMRSELINLVLSRALLEAELSDTRVERLILDHFDEVGARRIITWSIPDQVGTQRLAQNLSILDMLPDLYKVQVSNFIEVLTDRLAERGPNGFSEEVCAAWASLLWSASTTAPKEHLRAAAKTIYSTISLTSSPVGEVLAAAFPAVYLELSSRNGRSNEGIFSLFFALPRMLITDWDRAKPARHSLVDAFMNSNWPPSYLLLAASRSDIVDRICIRILRQRGGKEYLDQAVADLGRLTPEQVETVQLSLDGFSKLSMENEWD